MKADALRFLLPILSGGRQPWQLPHLHGSASWRGGDQSHPSLITVGSGCQLHDTPPTHPAGETVHSSGISREAHGNLEGPEMPDRSCAWEKMSVNITNTPEDERQAKGGKTWMESDKKKGMIRHLGNSQWNSTAFFLISERVMLLGQIQLH